MKPILGLHRLPSLPVAGGGGVESLCPSVGGSDGRVCLQSRRPGFDLWVGQIPGEGNGSPLQYSCLENPMDRGEGQVTVHEVAESDTTAQLTFTFFSSRIAFSLS